MLHSATRVGIHVYRRPYTTFAVETKLLRNHLETFVLAMTTASETTSSESAYELEGQGSLVLSGPAWLLGFAEKKEDAKELLRHHFPSKLGGRPAWLDPLDLPSERQLLCPATGKQMKFLLQLYAPVFETDSAFHRSIFLFISPKGNAIFGNGGCVAFRSQMKRENRFYSPMPPRASDTTPPPLPEKCIVSDPWKVQLYEASFTDRNVSAEIPEEMSLFPEFNLSIQEEFAELYSTSIAGQTDEALASPCEVTSLEVTTVEKMLTEEQKDFVEFQNRVAMAPDQCVRYCFEDEVEPVWPNKQKPMMRAEDVPNCERCGAPRKFEFQILPQVIHFLGCDESSEENSYDWGTIVVYSCSDSCDPEKHLPSDCSESQAYVREYVFVQRA